MKPSKVEICNLRDDEVGDMRVSASEVSPFDLIYGLIVGSMGAAPQSGFTKKEFVNLFLDITKDYNKEFARDWKEVGSDD